MGTCPLPLQRSGASLPMLSPIRARLWLLQAQEAEALYQACIREANSRQQDLEATKQRIVSHIRKLVLQGDEVMRRVRPFPPAERPAPLLSLNCLQDTGLLHLHGQPVPTPSP